MTGHVEVLCELGIISDNLLFVHLVLGIGLATLKFSMHVLMIRQTDPGFVSRRSLVVGLVLSKELVSFTFVFQPRPFVKTNIC